MSRRILLEALDPGSSEAITAGCTCDPRANNHGQGHVDNAGVRVYTPDENCPIHGIEQVMRALNEEPPQVH